MDKRLFGSVEEKSWLSLCKKMSPKATQLWARAHQSFAKHHIDQLNEREKTTE
jgi:hypothetical protein